MPAVAKLSSSPPTVSQLALWPIPGDTPDIRVIITDQAELIQQQAVLIDAYQANLNLAQNPLPGTAATGTGAATSGSTTSVVINGVSGTIAIGATVTNASSVPAGTKILGQISGATGSNGTYLFSQAVNFTATVSLTLTPPPPAPTWPTPTDGGTLMLVQQDQTAIIRTQSSLLQQYQDLLNISQTPAPPTGP